jgi:ATPase subunit of ABC transporter with duplicated ATPase domains
VVEAALREFRGTILMTTHDAYFARTVGVTRRWELHDGHVDEAGQV